MMQRMTAAPRQPDLDVAIIGAGISGISMAAHLARDLPGLSFTLIERRARAGGTWDLFRYPGVRSDSDMPRRRIRRRSGTLTISIVPITIRAPLPLSSV